MRGKRFSEEQIIGILKEAEAGIALADLTRKHGIAEGPYYRWKSKYRGLDLNKAKRLRHLEEENRRLKHLLADAMLDNAVLKDAISRN